MRDQLCGRCCNFVRRDDHLLELVPSAVNTIGSLDQHIRRRSNSLRNGDEAFRPSTVALVESRTRASSLALRHYLLLRYRLGLDEPSDSGNCGLQDGEGLYRTQEITKGRVQS